MSTEHSKYAVIIERSAERYYIKRFKKKYSKRPWEITQSAIETICANPERAILVGKLETIISSRDVLICKLMFSVAGTKRSPKASGNRAIVAVHKNEKVSYVLLVYHKSDLGAGGETRMWKKMIGDNFSRYKGMIK